MGGRIIKTGLDTLQRRVKAAVGPLDTESQPIKKTQGRVLAETLRAPHPYPATDNSAMDGFALRQSDIRGATTRRPISLPIIGTIAAGDAHRKRLKPGCAVRIMTGAPLPSGADCVVRVEDVHVDDDRVVIDKAYTRYHDVRLRGSDIGYGQAVLRKGTVIGPSEMAMIALLDQPAVDVYRRPRVGILSTGNELSEVGKPHRYGHIPDSNRYGLIGLVASAGCTAVDGGRAGDSPAMLLRRLKSLTSKCDFIVTTGGVSAGDYDVVKKLFLAAGGVNLYRLPMKPGKPQAFGHVAGVPFFGLPGNPVSSMVVFDVLVRPALRKMAGARQTEPLTLTVRAAVRFPRKTRHWEFPRVRLELQGGRYVVRPVTSQRSSNLLSMTEADGYVVLAPQDSSPRRGDEVIFVPFIR